jgi:hypothetical protein
MAHFINKAGNLNKIVSPIEMKLTVLETFKVTLLILPHRNLLLHTMALTLLYRLEKGHKISERNIFRAQKAVT